MSTNQAGLFFNFYFFFFVMPKGDEMKRVCWQITVLLDLSLNSPLFILFRYRKVKV